MAGLDTVLAIWSHVEGKYFCISTKNGAGKWKDHFFAREDLSQVRQFIRDHRDDNVYFCPHGFNRRSRTKDEAVPPALAYADLDHCDPNDLKGLKPTIAIESSPGRFVGIWLSKDVIPEEINQQLTYHIGADKGGWDLTQVLRFPGTYNYKYKTCPRVRVLWDDGRIFSLNLMKARLPEPDVNAGVTLDGAKVLKTYRGKLSAKIRALLMQRKIFGKQDRSKILYQLEAECLEAGMSEDEVIALLINSIWNKFADRRDGGESQLRKELEKITDGKFDEPSGLKGSDRQRQRDLDDEMGLEPLIPIGEIEERDIDWLWHPYLARGEITVLEGDPGLGKSYVAQMIGAAVAANKKLPNREGRRSQTGPVLYFDMENGRDTITKARLRHNGYGGLSNYYQMISSMQVDDEDDVERLTVTLRKAQPCLVVFDTINHYMGKTDTHKASDTVQAMNVFNSIAKEFNCAVLILRHLSKGTTAAMYRGQGSIAISGAARTVISTGVIPGEPDVRAIALTKSNNAHKPKALTFSINSIPEEGPDASRFSWGEWRNFSSTEIMNAASEAAVKKDDGGEGLAAAVIKMLKEQLSGTGRLKSRLMRMAERRGFTVADMEAAAVELGMLVTEEEDGTFWTLPTEK